MDYVIVARKDGITRFVAYYGSDLSETAFLFDSGFIFYSIERANEFCEKAKADTAFIGWAFTVEEY